MDSLFEHSDDELLISVYARQGRTLDDLPYTPEFEAIFEAYGNPGDVVHAASEQSEGAGSSGGGRAALFHRLHNLRKAGKLPRMGRAQSQPPRIEPTHEALLVELVEAQVGKLSKRDQLLYTPAFDEIVHALNAQAGLNLSPHDVWRIVAKLAK